MELRPQRILLVLIIFVLTLTLYREFGNEGTVRRLAKQAASLAGVKEQDRSLEALEPANATLGVGKQRSPAFILFVLTDRSISLVRSLQYRVNNRHVVTAFSSRPISPDLISRSQYSLFGLMKTSHNCVPKVCQVSHEDLR